ATEQTLPFLKKHLLPMARSDAKLLARLFAELESDQFRIRTEAARQLDKLGELAVDALERVLEGKPSPEKRKRVEGLLPKITRRSLASDQIRALRALEVLEHIGGLEVQQFLKTLAKGAPRTRLTEEAQATLERLVRRSAPPS